MLTIGEGKGVLDSTGTSHPIMFHEKGKYDDQ
jgi:hypothetical protein